MNTCAVTYPVITEIIPHRGSMLLLDQVLEADVETCTAVYAPRADAWYADSKGNMPAWVGIEIMAQAIAAHVGIDKRKNGLPPQMGMLLGTRSYKASCPFFQAGQDVLARVALSFRDESGLAAYTCELRSFDSTQVLAEAVLKVFEPDDFNEFLKGKTQ